MSLEIHTEGSCSNVNGRWSYTIKYRDAQSNVEELHSDNGEESGTTDIQMKLMAILKALSYIRSMDTTGPIVIKSDCSLCVKCVTKEFDCTSDGAFKRDKVTRGFVQYLQEIWWKMSGLDIRFETEESS
jgi:ribonuclease HI